MLSKLRAEENMNQTNVIAVGNGVMKKAQQKEMIRRWRRDAEKSDSGKTSRKATPFELRRIGIGIRTSKRKEDTE